MTLLATGPVTAGPRPSQQGLHPGDVVSDYGVSVVVPPAGHTLTAEALYPWGHQELTVTTHADGTVEILDQGHEAHSCEREETDPNVPAEQEQGEQEGNDLPDDGNEDNHGAECGSDVEPGDTPLDAPGACVDPTWGNLGYKEAHQHQWYFAEGSIPSNLGLSATRDAVQNGGQNIARVNNDCGLADNVSASLSYQGNTTVATNIDSNGSCYLGTTTQNNTSTVAFGTIDGTPLAKHCALTSNNDVVSSDIKFNKSRYTWTNTPGSDCSDTNRKYDVETVMTHERGHTFGLADLNEDLHGNLTMGGRIRHCSAKERTLGHGDVLGLENKY